MFSIDVYVAGGIATLRGTVNNLPAQRAAVHDARNTYGVLHVNNRLKVRSNNDLTDRKIKKAIEDAIARDPYVETCDASIEMNHGVEDLNGTVDTHFQRSHADRRSRFLEGTTARL